MNMAPYTSTSSAREEISQANIHASKDYSHYMYPYERLYIYIYIYTPMYTCICIPT